jgi:RNA polymerase primary sigma factor
MTSDLKEKQVQHEQIGQYLQDIRQYPRLSPEQERELARRCAEGDEEAIRKMVNSNLRLVVSVAREYAGRGVPLMDLIQEGSIGLLAAAKKFDYTLNFRFSTYATKWIRQGISRCLSEHGIIRVPTYTAERIRKINAAKAALLQQTGEEPTIEQIARACDMTPQKVIQLQQLEPGICSLDTPIGDGEEDFSALLENVQATQPYEELVRQELDQTMQTMLGALNERQQQVLRLHYGMEDGTCWSFAQIGEKLDITKERARQIEQQAMGILQKMGSTMGLEDYLE